VAGGQPGSLPGPATPPGPGKLGTPGTDDYKAAVRSDAAAELDRLTRNQKKSVSGSVEGNNSVQNNNSSEC